MKPLNFLYWLRGYLENKDTLSIDNVAKILENIGIVESKSDSISFLEGYLTCALNYWNRLSFTDIVEQINKEISKTIKEVQKKPIDVEIAAPLFPTLNIPKGGEDIFMETIKNDLKAYLEQHPKICTGGIVYYTPHAGASC